MSENGGEIKIENSVEGPQQKVVVHLSKREFEDQGYPKHSPINQNTWAYEQISSSLPSGELKKAFDLAKEERKLWIERKNDDLKFDILTRETLAVGSDRYMFRGAIRKSDGTPFYLDDRATLESVDINLHKHGIEAPGIEDMILPRRIWDMYTFPAPIRVDERGEDVSIIMVYRNEPFVLPNEKSEETVTMFDIENWKKEQISVQDAREKKYPTLRDIFIGQIEVRYEDNTNK